MKILIFFSVVVVIKISLNLYNFIRIKTLNHYHTKWLEGKREDFSLYKQETLALFKKAHISDVFTPVTQPVGYGHIASINASVFTMFPSKIDIIAYPAMDMFKEAEGVFRKNIFNAINPLYWIEFILFLPKELLTYIGFDTEKTAFKLCNVLFTFIYWACGILFTFFQPQLQQLIVELVGNL